MYRNMCAFCVMQFVIETLQNITCIFCVHFFSSKFVTFSAGICHILPKHIRIKCCAWIQHFFPVNQCENVCHCFILNDEQFLFYFGWVWLIENRFKSRSINLYIISKVFKQKGSWFECNHNISIKNSAWNRFSE